ncbi:MAG: MarR family transcriptional regulator [Rhodospirillales bacterium]|nr:MarR family transcriptional regulator [Rhodospirillales bacterium]
MEGMRKTSLTLGPWSDLDDQGTDLSVLDFLTTRLSALSNSLRRDLTTPYADQHGLSVSEWRVLSLIAHAKTLPFGILVVQSTSDKALVSRTVRLLVKRDLVSVRHEGGKSRKRLLCSITLKGKALHAKIIPIARREQARALRALSPAEREAFLSAIEKLQAYCDTELAGAGAPATRRPAASD